MSKNLEVLSEKGYFNITQIGIGNYGSVYKATSSKDNKIYAIKVTGYTPGQLIESQIEIKNLIKVSLDPNCYPGIPCYYGSFVDSGFMYIIMEYIEGEEMQNFFSKFKRTHDKNAVDRVACNLLRQLLETLDHLRSVGIVHADIKPPNIKIVSDNKGNYRAYLLDFGISCTVPCEDVIGTPVFRAPEAIDEFKVYYESDLWSLGLSFYDVLLGRLPVDSVFLSYETDKRNFNFVLKNMTNFDRSRRLSPRQLLKKLELSC